MAGKSNLSENQTQIYRRRSRPAHRRTHAYRRPAPAVDPPDLYLPVPGRRAESARSRRRRWPALILAGLLLLLVAGGSVLGGAYLYQRQRIMPGVHTLGVNLGGQRVTEATVALSQNWERRKIRLAAADAPAYTLSPSTLGIRLDAEATARIAYRQGRSIRDFQAALRHAFSENGFEPVWYFDPAVARGALGEIAQQVAVPAVDAGIRYAGGRVETTPSRPGRALDVEATVSWLGQNAGLVVLSGRLPLVTHIVQPEITDSSAVAAQINEQLGQTIRLVAYDPVRDEVREAVVPPEVWTGWLAVRPDGNAAGRLSWDVDERQAAAYLEAQAAAFGADRYLQTETAAKELAAAIRDKQTAVQVRIYHHSRAYTVQPGETLSSIAYDVGIPYPWIQQANPGSGDGLRPGETITIPSPDVLIPLPVVRDKRITVSLSQQRMWAYENGALLWEWPVSTGIESSPTAPGIFQVQSHETNAYAGNWDLWMPNFMGIYRPVPTSDFMNGFHGFPTRNGANLLWTNSLGRPVTYGCILLSNDNAPRLFEWAEEGVIVEVRR